MMWVRAETAGELASMMRAADLQLPPERSWRELHLTRVSLGTAKSGRLSWKVRAP